MNRAARTNGGLECGRDRSQGFSQQRTLSSFGSCSADSYGWRVGSLRFLPCPRLQFLVSRFAIDRFLIMTGKDGGTYNLFSLIRRDRADLTARRNNLGAFDNLRAAIF